MSALFPPSSDFPIQLFLTCSWDVNSTAACAAAPSPPAVRTNLISTRAKWNWTATGHKITEVHCCTRELNLNVVTITGRESGALGVEQMFTFYYKTNILGEDVGVQRSGSPMCMSTSHFYTRLSDGARWHQSVDSDPSPRCDLRASSMNHRPARGHFLQLTSENQWLAMSFIWWVHVADTRERSRHRDPTKTTATIWAQVNHTAGSADGRGRRPPTTARGGVSSWLSPQWFSDNNHRNSNYCCCIWNWTDLSKKILKINIFVSFVHEWMNEWKPDNHYPLVFIWHQPIMNTLYYDLLLFIWPN